MDSTGWVVGLARGDGAAALADAAGGGAEVAFDGRVEDQLLGSGDPWERLTVLRCPGGRPPAADLAARVATAPTPDALVLACHPATGDLAVPDLGLDQPDWSEVPHPPTADDGPVMVLHLTRYAEAGGREAMARYQAEAARTAVPHGVQVAGWFDIDATLAGDGRLWDQVRFNRFPSKEAFLAVVFDPARLEAQAAHREPALADTYTLIVRPTVDELGEVR